MAPLSPLRKLVSFVVAILIATTLLQPVQARLISADGDGAWTLSAPANTNSHGLLGTDLYISEESDGQMGRKGPSQRLGQDDPLTLIAEIFADVLISPLRYAPPYAAPIEQGGFFLSPLKTGPPAI